MLDRPLAFTHLGVIIQNVGGTGQSIDMRAEVGVLTRDIVVQASGPSQRMALSGSANRYNLG